MSNNITENRLAEIEDALFEGMHDSSAPDHVPASNPKKLDAVLRSLSLHELREFHHSRMRRFGDGLASAAILESHTIIRPGNCDGFMLLVQLDDNSEVDVLSLRDLLVLTQGELDRRSTEDAA